MAEKDFMDQAVEEYMGWEEKPTTPEEPIAPNGEEPQVPIPEVPVKEPEGPVIAEPQKAVLSENDILGEFNKLTGLDFDTIEKAKQFADKVSKIPEWEQQLSVVPELVDALDKVQNPMNYFSDETAFKVAMLSKDPKYKGKEGIINEIMRGDLSSLDDIKIIALAASLKASQGVRSPLRAELRGMNIDPDVVIDSYDDLDEDTKDLLKIRADQYRDDLSKIGSDIKAPSFEGTTVEKLLQQKKAAQEDYAASMEKVKPTAINIIKEIKELKVTDDFAFKIELTKEQETEYAEDLAEMIVSGNYDLSTKEGKARLYGALMDRIKADNFDKAVSAFSTFKTSKIEEEMRRKYNNEQPLSKHEPNPTSGEPDKDWITVTAEKLVSERQ